MTTDSILLLKPTDEDIERCTPQFDYMMTDRVLSYMCIFLGTFVARFEILDEQMKEIHSRLQALECHQALGVARVKELNDAIYQEIDRTLPASLVLNP